MAIETDRIYRYQPLWGSWQIEGFLGEGSYGRVYRAVRKDRGGEYHSAVKLISIPKSAREISDAENMGMDALSVYSWFDNMVTRMIREINIMYELRGSENIVSYEDHAIIHNEGETSWDVLIRMELLVPLTKYLAANALTASTVCRLGAEIASALCVCAKRKIIHRDVKEANIFVNKDGVFKLGDFGIARSLSESASGGMSMKGTPAYLAPEIYLCKPYDATVDIYSLGILLYKLLNNGRYPFLPPYPQPISFSDSEDAINRRIRGEKLPLPAYGSNLLKSIVLKACSYNAAERFQSAEELKAALMDCIRSEDANLAINAGFAPATVQGAEVRTTSAVSGSFRPPTAQGFSREPAPVYNQHQGRSLERNETVALAYNTSAVNSMKKPETVQDTGKKNTFQPKMGAQNTSQQHTGGAQITEETASLERMGGNDGEKRSAGLQPPPAPSQPSVSGKRRSKTKLFLSIFIPLGVVLMVTFSILISLLSNGAFTDRKAGNKLMKSTGVFEGNTLETSENRGGLHHIASNSDIFVGVNADGTVSIADTTGLIDDRVAVESWSNIVSAEIGWTQIAGLKSDGTVVAETISGDYGQCEVSNWSDIVSIAAGAYHTVGLKTDGTVVAVGENSNGQCDVSNWSDIVAIAAGTYHTVGLRADGTVLAVGGGGKYTQSGKDEAKKYGVGIAQTDCGQCDVSDWSNIVAISAGGDNTAGIRADGTVAVVGDNSFGQCDLSDWSEITSVAVMAYPGATTLCGVRRDGTVLAKGNSNDHGQLEVSGWSGIVAAAGTWCNTIGLRSDGSIVTAGETYNIKEITAWNIFESKPAKGAAVNETDMSFVYLGLSEDIQYYASSFEGIGNYCEEFGISCSAMYCNYDSETQIRQLRDCIEKGVDAVICAPADPSVMGGVVAEARENGTVVISQWNAIAEANAGLLFDYSAYIEMVGQNTCEWIATHMNGKKNVQVGLITVDGFSSEVGDALERAIKDGSDAETVMRPTAYGIESAMAVTQTMLEAYPDMRVITCFNSGQAVGAWQAVSMMGIDADEFYIGCGEMNAEHLSYIRDEKCAIHSAVDFMPQEAGYNCAKLAMDVLVGKAQTGETRYQAAVSVWQPGMP